jgi:hypothetical protein
MMINFKKPPGSDKGWKFISKTLADNSKTLKKEDLMTTAGFITGDLRLYLNTH